MKENIFFINTVNDEFNIFYLLTNEKFKSSRYLNWEIQLQLVRFIKLLVRTCIPIYNTAPHT